MRKPNWFIGFPVEKAEMLKEVIVDPPVGYRVFHSLDIHLTFAFLGAVDQEKAYAAWEVAERSHCMPIDISLGTLEPFGPKERPSAFSFTIKDGSEELRQCKNACQFQMLEAAGQPPDPWGDDWRPHITVARPPRDADDAVRASGYRWAQKILPPTELLQLTRLALYTWHEDRQKRQFKIVASQLLG